MTDNDAVVLAAAGSSNPNAAKNVEELADQSPGPAFNRIVAGYGASAKPSVPDAVAMLREEAAGGAGAGESAGAWTWADAWSSPPTSWRPVTSMTSWPRRARTL